MAICGSGVQVHTSHAAPVVVPSVPVKSNSESSTIVRAVLSESQVVSWARDVGVAAAAEPPPVVADARPNGVPTARTCGKRLIAARRDTKVELSCITTVIIPGNGDRARYRQGRSTLAFILECAGQPA